MPYTFIPKGVIGKEDVGKLIELTKDGALRWERDQYALNAYPVAPGAVDTQTASVTAVGDNLRGVRMGYDENRHWHYLRLTAHDGREHYIDAGSPKELMELVDQLYTLVLKAERFGGTLKSASDELHICKACGKETPHKHLIDSPYGLQGAYMAGSERLTCTVCETSIPANSLQEA